MMKMQKTCWTGSGKRHAPAMICCKVTATEGVCLALSSQSFFVHCHTNLHSRLRPAFCGIEHRPCLKLPTHISKEQRAHWHRLAEHKGLTSQSQVWKLDMLNRIAIIVP